MLPYLRVLWKILFCFRDYEPQPVTLLSVWRWLFQFPSSCRNRLFRLLDYVIFVSERTTVQDLISLNQNILDKLSSDGIGLDSIICVAVDTAGSSSHVMLKMLRDAENLVRKGARLVDSQDARSLKKLTSDIGFGAIIYVDDFAGTGKQFRRNRDWAYQFIVGAFSEFFLAPVICEEAHQRIAESGVVPITRLRHTIGQRPLHQHSDILADDCREDIVNLCKTRLK